MKERSPNAPRTIPTFNPSGSAAGAAVVAGESIDSSSATTSTTSSVAVSDPPQADRTNIRDSRIKEDFLLFVIIYLLLHYLNNDYLSLSLYGELPNQDRNIFIFKGVVMRFLL
jgi:hypothetical protein